MKKNKLIKELNVLENKIFKYFNEHENGELTILDSDTRTYLTEEELKENNTYKAVTVNYIKKYLLNNKYSFSMIHYTLLHLFKNKRIKTFRCNDINKVIFTAYEDYGSNTINDIFNKNSKFYNLIFYKTLLKHYNSINSYLKNNKIENTNN